jgi:hypothetical protein
MQKIFKQHAFSVIQFDIFFDTLSVMQEIGKIKFALCQFAARFCTYFVSVKPMIKSYLC